MKADWIIRVERLEIDLAVGIHPHELEPQTLWVSLALMGRTDAVPSSIDQCLDYDPLCEWLMRVWPSSPHTPLLETRLNQLLEFVFGLDARVQGAWAGLYKQRMSRGAMAIGIERTATRPEFEAQRSGHLEV
jgi:dihydroneopterin aldolase